MFVSQHLRLKRSSLLSSVSFLTYSFPWFLFSGTPLGTALFYFGGLQGINWGLQFFLFWEPHRPIGDSTFFNFRGLHFLIGDSTKKKDLKTVAMELQMLRNLFPRAISTKLNSFSHCLRPKMFDKVISCLYDTY